MQLHQLQVQEEEDKVWRGPTLTLLYCLTDMFWLVAFIRDLDKGYTRVFLHFLYVDICRMLSTLILDVKDPDHPMPNTRIHLRGEKPSARQVFLMLWLTCEYSVNLKCLVISYRCFFPIFGQLVLTACSGRGERVFNEYIAKRYTSWVCFTHVTHITADI